MPNQTAASNGSSTSPALPPEFEVILATCRTPAERDAMTKMLFLETGGDPCSIMVQQATLISGLILQLQKMVETLQSVYPEKFSGKLDELIRKIPDVEKAAKDVRDVHANAFQWAIVAAFAIGIIATVAVEHLFFH